VFDIDSGDVWGGIGLREKENKAHFFLSYYVIHNGVFEHQSVFHGYCLVESMSFHLMFTINTIRCFMATQQIYDITITRVTMMCLDVTITVRKQEE
jgi:hypothetical protein